MAKKCVLAREAGLRLLEARLDVLQQKAKGLKKEDPDAIHDTRVASRRVRAALQEHASVFKKRPLTAFEKSVKRITRGLGTPRELDVSIDLLESFREATSNSTRLALNHALRKLCADRKAASSDVAACAKRTGSKTFIKASRDVLKKPATGNQCYVKQARTNLGKQFDDLAQLYAAGGKTPSDKQTHQVRIACKKFRYVCELYVPLHPEDFNTFIDQLHQFQDALGEWNDLRILRDHVQCCADGAPPKTAKGYPTLLKLVNTRLSKAAAAVQSFGDNFFSKKNLENAQKIIRKLDVGCCGEKKPKPVTLKRYK